MSDTPLITKYRPADFDEVVGQETQVAALQRTLKTASLPHSYLFTGPSGTGKTTLARILSKHLDAEITEIDAASNNGVDAMREIIEFCQHMSFLGNGRKLMIIDECHMLSRNAWNAILKLLEEPPMHCFFALCTTELIKVPDTIVTRSFHLPLKPLSINELDDLVSVVIDAEQWKVVPDVVSLVLQSSQGSPRLALSILQKVHSIKTREEAKRVVSLIEASDPMIELCQYLLAGKRSWKLISQILSKIDSEGFEEASLQAGRYISGALLREDSDTKAQKVWQLLDALVFPTSTYDKKVAFIAAVGRMCFGE